MIPRTLLALLAAAAGWAADAPPVQPANAGPVTVAEDAGNFTLANGLVSARITKTTGTLNSLQYRGLELLAQHGGGAGGGYWSSVGRARPGTQRLASVRINPATNGGERVEISCRLTGDAASGSSPVDLDIRYSLGRGEHWLYTYAIWDHRPGYPFLSVGEARYCLKLNPDVFDFLTVDAARRRVMPTGYDWDHGSPLNVKEARRMTTGVHAGEAEHKYGYAAVLQETPAYGWSSTKHSVGLWIVNPSMEYIGGGPTKAELTGHLDVNPGGLPTLLNMWLGSHYGGTALSVAPEESWTKLIGPFLIYCNTAAGHEALWQDALAQAATEAARWPYAWLVDSNYPPAAQRGTVSGQIVLRDAYAPEARMSNLWVGVTAPNQPSRGFNRGGFPPEVDWQRDSKFYQFWTRADAEGRFTIRNIRPGTYWLRAIADGVIGEFTRTNVVVASAETRSLGTLEWMPRRFGRTLWQIGVPDRTAREFRHGDDYWHWGTFYQYAKEFPSNVNFVIGQSDWRRDWNYVQPPRILDRSGPAISEDNADPAPPRNRFGGRGVESTTWTISFDLPKAVAGTATLRLAFCGTHQGCEVEVFVNGQSVGDTGPLPSTSAMQRDGIRAFWVERPVSFSAALLKPGQNVIKLLSHASSWSQGVMYDCVRLELEESPISL